MKLGRTPANSSLRANSIATGGRIAAHAGHEGHLHQLEGLAVLVGALLHGRGDRADEAVGHQNTEEGSDQRGGHLVADGRGIGALDRGHGAHDAQHRRDDAESGQRVGDLLHGMRGLGGFLMMGLKLVSSRLSSSCGSRLPPIIRRRQSVMNSIMW